MGLDQSSRAVELKPLKEKRKGFRHTLAIQKAGRTDSDDMRVYRWLKAYIKQADPHRTPPRWRRADAAGRTARRRSSGATEPPPHTPHPRRARAGPARPAAKCYGTRTRRLKITSYRACATYRAGPRTLRRAWSVSMASSRRAFFNIANPVGLQLTLH